MNNDACAERVFSRRPNKRNEESALPGKTDLRRRVDVGFHLFNLKAPLNIYNITSIHACAFRGFPGSNPLTTDPFLLLQPKKKKKKSSRLTFRLFKLFGDISSQGGGSYHRP